MKLGRQGREAHQWHAWAHGLGNGNHMLRLFKRLFRQIGWDKGSEAGWGDLGRMRRPPPTYFSGLETLLPTPPLLPAGTSATCSTTSGARCLRAARSCSAAWRRCSRTRARLRCGGSQSALVPRARRRRSTRRRTWWRARAARRRRYGRRSTGGTWCRPLGSRPRACCGDGCRRSGLRCRCRGSGGRLACAAAVAHAGGAVCATAAGVAAAGLLVGLPPFQLGLEMLSCWALPASRAATLAAGLWKAVDLQAAGVLGTVLSGAGCRPSMFDRAVPPCWWSALSVSTPSCRRTTYTSGCPATGRSTRAGVPQQDE
eukprot:141229-Chlamydomonas_euryale.AAC.4